MPIPEYVAPALHVGGSVALVLVILRFGPDAFLRLLAGTVAVLGDEKRAKRCLDLLRILRGRDTPPPSPPSGSPSGRLPEARPRGARGLRDPRRRGPSARGRGDHRGT